MNGSVEVGLDKESTKFKKMLSQSKKKGLLGQDMSKLIKAKIKSEFTGKKTDNFVYPISYENRQPVGMFEMIYNLSS